MTVSRLWSTESLSGLLHLLLQSELGLDLGLLHLLLHLLLELELGLDLGLLHMLQSLVLASTGLIHVSLLV